MNRPGARFVRLEEDRAGRQVAVVALTVANVTSIHRLVLSDSTCKNACPNCHACRCEPVCSEPRCTCRTLFGVEPAGGATRGDAS